MKVSKMLMVLRPYQHHAVEAIVERGQEHREVRVYLAYHRLRQNPDLLYKQHRSSHTLPKYTRVVFVVDRKDLDYQTIKEFNSFSEGSVDATNNTKKLVQQFGDDTSLDRHHLAEAEYGDSARTATPTK